MAVDTDLIPANVAAVQERIKSAAQRAGRSLAEITLVAVTRNVPISSIKEAWRCGLRNLGESRVQETTEKKASLAIDQPQGITWHLIGHLQTNKAKKALDLFDLIQSLDSLSLAEILDRESEKRAKVLPCLVEIKVSDEPAKFGVRPEETESFLDSLQSCHYIRVDGLMTIAPYFDDPEKARPYFRKMRKLFERLSERFGHQPILSMGMSQDFEIAVEEGSTMVRVGTALFGQRPAGGPR